MELLPLSQTEKTFLKNYKNKLDAVVELTIGCWLKPTESQELLTKKVTENPILTDRFIIFYGACLKIDQLCFVSLKNYSYFWFY